MIHKIVSVYDVKAECFAQPVFVQSHGAAVRSFGDAVNEPSKENNFAKYPQDFTLFALGEFDDATGEFTISSPMELAKGISLIEERTPRTLPSPSEEAA
jgi:hypothetical protein